IIPPEPSSPGSSASSATGAPTPAPTSLGLPACATHPTCAPSASPARGEWPRPVHLAGRVACGAGLRLVVFRWSGAREAGRWGMSHTASIQAKARELLEPGAVACVIGYQIGLRRPAA